MKRMSVVATAGLAAVALLAGCTAGAEGAEPEGDVRLTWWHTFTAEPLLSFWDDVAAQFEAAHPGVVVETRAVSDFEDALEAAFADGTAPDVFQTGLDVRVEGRFKDLSDWVPAPVAGVAEAFRVGDAIHAMPYTALPSGFWVNMNLWEQAGLTETDFPDTLDDLFDRWQTLKDAGIVPVAVGGADEWATAHWWYWAALRSVSPEALQAAIVDGDFSDDGWLEASTLTQTILDQGAFHPDWQDTPAQSGDRSASGMVVFGEAAMQLMGTWDHAVMGQLYNEANGLPEDAQEHAEFLRWFPFPQVPGGAGDQTAIMGGIDAFSARADAPAEAAELIAFIVSTEVQQALAATHGFVPVDAGATASMPEGPLSAAAAAVADASSAQRWLDTALGRGFDSGVDAPIVAFMSGHADPQDVVDALTALAQE